MSTSIAELLPVIATLSHPDKFRLVQLVLAQIAQEDDQAQKNAPPFDPRSFFGVTHQSRQAIDDYLESTREGWL